MNDSNNEMGRSRGVEVSLLEIIRLLISKIHWLIFFGILGCIFVFFATRLLIAPQYQSSIKLYIYNNASTSTSSSGSIESSDIQAAKNLAAAYTQIVKSNVTLEEVKRILQPQFDMDFNTFDFSKAVSAEADKDSPFFVITVTTNSKELSYQIAKAYEQIAPSTISKTIKAGEVTTVNHAEMPEKPSSPNITLFSALGFISGALFTALFWIIRTLLDTTIYISDDIKDICDITVLGQIFELDVDKKDEKQWSIVEGGYIYANRKDT